MRKLKPYKSCFKEAIKRKTYEEEELMWEIMRISLYDDQVDLYALADYLKQAMERVKDYKITAMDLSFEGEKEPDEAEEKKLANKIKALKKFGLEDWLEIANDHISLDLSIED